MARATVIFDSMNTDEIREAIVALRHEQQVEGKTEAELKQGTVGVNGPRYWTFTTPAITPAQAAMVCHAVTQARPAGLSATIGAPQPIRVANLASLEELFAADPEES